MDNTFVMKETCKKLDSLMSQINIEVGKLQKISTRLYELRRNIECAIPDDVEEDLCLDDIPDDELK